MKKLLSLILVFTMLMSVFAINTFAYTDYTTVWTQDFENAAGSSIAGGGTSTGAFLQKDAHKYVEGATSQVVAAGKRTKTGTEAVIMKVFIDNSVLEEGAVYKITAKAMHKNSEGARTITVRPLKNTGSDKYSDGATKSNPSINELTWTEVSSNEFVYNAANIESGSTLNVRFELYCDANVTLDQRLYIDDVKLIKVVNVGETKPTDDKSVFASYKAGDTIDFENLSYDVLRAYVNDSTVYDIDKNGVKYIMNDPLDAGQGKVLRGSGWTDGSYSRNEIANIMQTELDSLGTLKGQVYKVSLKLYPEGTSTENIRLGFKSNIQSATENSHGVTLKKGTHFEEGKWNSISTYISISASASAEPVNMYIDQRGSKQLTAACYNRIWIDDIKIERVEPLFKNAGRSTVIDFENVDRALYKGLDWTGNVTGGLGVVSNAEEGIGESGKSLAIKAPGTDGNATRISLLDIFNENDNGKKVKVTLKVYPKGESEKGIRIGAKYTSKDDKTYNSNWGTYSYHTVGDEKELIPNTWNNISVVLEIKEVGGFLTNALAIDQRDSTSIINNIYIDDIKIEELGTSYFDGIYKGEKITIDFEEGATNTLTFGEDITSGGAFNGYVKYSNEKVHNGNYSLKMSGITHNQHRIKLIGALKNANVGDTLKISGWFYGENAGKLCFGAIADETTTKAFRCIDLNAGQWTYGEFLYKMQKDPNGNLRDEITIDQLNDGEELDTPYNTTLYIDDLTIEPVDLTDKIAYVSQNGSDANAGISESAPLKTLNQALRVPVSKVILLDNTNYDVISWHDQIAIAGKTSDVVLSLPENAIVRGNLKLENLVLKGNSEIIYQGSGDSAKTVTNSANIFANGYKLEIADTVTSYTDGTNTSYFLVYGGGNNTAKTGNTDIRIYGGKYVRIFGGGYNASATVTGNTNVVVGGNVNADENANATILTVCGGGRNAKVTGEANVTITGNASVKFVSGAGYSTYGTVPKANVNIEGGKVMNVFGGSLSSAITCDTCVTITGGKAEAIFGGSQNQPMTGNAVVNLLGGEVTRRVYGGCYNEFDYKFISATWGGSDCVTGTTNIVIGPNVRLNTKSGLSGTDAMNVGVFAGSRIESNSADEVSTIIFINDAYDTKSNVIGEKGGIASSYLKSHTDYIVDASAGGSIVPSKVGGTVTIIPDAGKYAIVNGKEIYINENNVALNGGTNTIVFTSGNIVASFDVLSDETGAVANVTCVVEDEDAKLIVAIYSSESEMIAAKAVDASSNKTSYEVDVDFDYLNAKGCMAKVMLWDNSNIPLADLLETTVK